MKLVSCLLVFLLLSFLSNCKADNHTEEAPNHIELKTPPGVFEIGLILGSSELSIDKQYTISQESFKTDALSIGVELGYRSPKKYLIQTSFTSTADLDIFGISDNYHLYQWNTLVGYSFALSDKINFIPKIGFSRWELDAREGMLFNPGPELELEFKDTDVTYQLGLEFLIWNDLSLELAYENTKYNFGEIEIVNFGISFEF